MNDISVIECYRRIIQAASDSSRYTEAAKQEFASVADSWICAHALAHQNIIVTQERYNPQSKKRVIIPNMCKEFDIECIDRLGFLRNIGMRFD